MAATLAEHSVLGVIRAARPSFRNAHDKVAFAVHSCFLASGFVLHATGPPAFTDDALSSTSTTEEVGIDNWNEFDDYYAFVYSTPNEGSKRILVKCLAMNDKLLVDAIGEGDSEPVHLEINVGEFVSENGEKNYTSMFKNFGKLVTDIEKQVLRKFIGSSSASSSSEKASSESRGGAGDDFNQPRHRVEVPDPDDPSSFEPIRGYIVPPVPGIGHDDLFPGPGAGVYPTRGGFGGSGGMLVGPNDPRFGFQREPRMPGGPPEGIPPGARFDPYGPPGVPGFEPNRYVRNPRRPGGGNHPDLQHFRDGSDII